MWYEFSTRIYQMKYSYPFPRPQFLWYSGYRIGENMELGWKKWCQEALVAYRKGDVVDMCNSGTAKYRFVLWSNLRKQMLTFRRIFNILSSLLRQIISTQFSSKWILFERKLFIFFPFLQLSCKNYFIFTGADVGGLPLHNWRNQSDLFHIVPQDLAANKTEEMTQQPKLSTHDA